MQIWCMRIIIIRMLTFSFSLFQKVLDIAYNRSKSPVFKWHLVLKVEIYAPFTPYWLSTMYETTRRILQTTVWKASLEDRLCILVQISLTDSDKDSETNGRQGITGTIDNPVHFRIHVSTNVNQIKIHDHLFWMEIK